MRILWELVCTLAVRGLFYGTVVIGMIFLFRWMLRGLPRRAVVWLWLPLLVLLFSPVLPKITVPMPAAEPAWMQTVQDSGIPDIAVTDDGAKSDTVVGAAAAADETPERTESAAAGQKTSAVMTAVVTVWMCGAFGVGIWMLVRVRQTRTICAGAVPRGKRGRISVFCVEHLRTPFVYGVLRPSIYLPAELPADGEVCEMILAHEEAHVQRGDVLWRYFGTAALCLYWFQPLIWLSFGAFLADNEGACDEAVLARLGSSRELRTQYAQALLAFASETPMGISASFGMKAMEGRVRTVLYPGTLRLGGMLGLLAAVLLMGCTVAVTPEFSGTGEILTTVVTENANTVTLGVEPTSELFGFAEGYVEAHPEIWGPFSVTAELPVGWTLSAETPVTGHILNTDGETAAAYTVSVFAPIDSPEIPPENVPPEELRWQAIYSHLRLSMMQNVSDADYTPVVSGERFENAVALMYYMIPQEGVPAAGWESDRAPLVLAFDQDCSAYLQMTFEGAPVSEERLRAIAESIIFTKQK